MTSKIEVGDKLHIEFTVTDVSDHDGYEVKLLTLDGTSRIIVFNDDQAIVKHLSKPYEPEVDDTVRLNALAADPLSPYKVIALHAGRAWCRSVSTGVDKFYNFNLLVFVSKG